MSIIVGQNTVTISDVIPILDSLETAHLKHQEDDSSLTNEIRKRVLNTLLARYTAFSDMQQSQDYRQDIDDVSQMLMVVTYLDPRYKGAYSEPDLMSDLLLFHLVKQGHRLNDDDDERDCTVVPDSSPIPSKRCKTSPLQNLITNRAATASDSNSSNLSLREKLALELKIYTAEAPAHDESASYVIGYWKQKCRILPLLGAIAHRWLSIPATSVPSERVFSISGHIVNKKRSCLKPSKVQQLVFLSVNK